MKLKCGFEAIAVPDDEAEKINEKYDQRPHRYVKVQEVGYMTYDSYLKYADRYYDFKFYKDDVLLMGFARSGTTWSQEILWTMLHNPNLDNTDACIPVNSRVPYFEHDILLSSSGLPRIEPGNVYYDAFVKEFPGLNPEDGIMLQTVENRNRPRITKTHLVFSLLNPNIMDTCKIVYIARNPKDVIVSVFHSLRLLKDFSYTGTFDDMISSFTDDTNAYALIPRFWVHLREAWERRNHPNVHFMYFEDLKANTKAEFTRLKNFLGIHLTEEQLDKIVHYTSFDVLKSRESEKTKNLSYGYNPNVEKEGGFFRKGVTGDSKGKYTEEQEQKIDEWIKKNVKVFGPDFKYSV